MWSELELSQANVGPGLILCLVSVPLGLVLGLKSSGGRGVIEQVLAPLRWPCALSWLVVFALRPPIAWIRIWASLGALLFLASALAWFRQVGQRGSGTLAGRLQHLYLIQLNLLLMATVALTPG